MLIFGMQVAFDNTQLVRVISSRSRSNIKVTLFKSGLFGGISVSQTHLVFSRIEFFSVPKRRMQSHVYIMILREPYAYQTTDLFMLCLRQLLNLLENGIPEFSISFLSPLAKTKKYLHCYSH